MRCVEFYGEGRHGFCKNTPVAPSENSDLRLGGMPTLTECTMLETPSAQAHYCVESPSFPDIPYRAIVEQSLAGIYVLQDERFQYVNSTFAGILGYAPQEMIGLSLQDIVPADFLHEVLEIYRQRISGELTNARFISRGRHKAGQVVLIEVHGIRIEYQGQPAVVGVGIDVTERERRNQELQDSRAELRELTSHINTVREEQRGKFARELHDVLGGMLTSIKMDATRIMRRANTQELVDITQGLLDLSQETIDTVRKISEDLRPSVLDQLGLEAAINGDLRKFAGRYNIECHFNPDDLAIPLSEKLQTTIYRIFQEALTNVARHAEASQVFLRLYSDADNTVCMDMMDDGVGLKPSGHKKTFGILGMTERARELGGTFEISRRPEGGTVLHLRIPS